MSHEYDFSLNFYLIRTCPKSKPTCHNPPTHVTDIPITGIMLNTTTGEDNKKEGHIPSLTSLRGISLGFTPIRVNYKRSIQFYYSSRI